MGVGPCPTFRNFMVGVSEEAQYTPTNVCRQVFHIKGKDSLATARGVDISAGDESGPEQGVSGGT